MSAHPRHNRDVAGDSAAEAAGQSAGAATGWPSRLAWFVGLWIVSVLTLGVIGWGIKKVLQLE